MLRRLHFELRYLLRNSPWDTGVSPPELYRFLEEHAPGRAIDLGCGTGTNVITLAERGWQAVGVDLSAKAIGTARRKAADAGVDATFLRADVLSLPPDLTPEGSWHLALDIGCLHTLGVRGRSRYLGRLAELVAPEGTYLLYSFLGDPTVGASRWPAEGEILELARPAFDVERVERGNFRDRPSAWFTFRRRR